ncbi:MAG: tRNA pseudouridine(55) synthase TruB [Betaproteobacteria bacterium]|nr:tRNA pseudouridine(55) synthase TruB [Betaproteobacteria bacterium]
MAARPESKERPARHAVDGVLLIDKGLGLSSNQALQRAKRLLNAKKAGHTGTLDPAATGLLVLCFGEATKLAGVGLGEDKTYEACVHLGVSTDTGDVEGQVTARQAFTGSDQDIENVLGRLRGEVEQVPPMYSALKHEGKPLYDYARAGQTIERQARVVHISELVALRREGDKCWIRVSCSKGTYIRVLAEQIGEALGCPAHLAALRRTRVGGLEVREAQSVDALEAQPMADRLRRLLPSQILLESMPLVVLDEAAERAVRLGQVLHRDFEPAGMVRLHGPSGTLVGLAEARAGGTIHPKRILNLRLEEQGSSPIQ